MLSAPRLSPKMHSLAMPSGGMSNFSWSSPLKTHCTWTFAAGESARTASLGRSPP